jgi:hypothetical protein
MLRRSRQRFLQRSIGTGDEAIADLMLGMAISFSLGTSPAIPVLC